MHYLITGGAGFIGSHLAERLIAAGHRVSVIDNLSTGKRANLPESVSLTEADITSPHIFAPLLNDVDGCFHLAAIASVQLSQTDWLRSHQVNQSGTVALLEAIARSGQKIPVVFASSAAVYGNPASTPIDETFPNAPLSAYGADKLASEWHGRVAATTHGIPFAAMRFFNVYGSRQDPTSPYSGVISIFASRMKQSQPVTIYGDGTQARDFIHVSDITAGLTQAMQSLQQGSLRFGVFNLCTENETSVNELSNVIKSLTHSTSAITHAPARNGDIHRSVGNASAAKKAFGFAPRYTLKEGLELTLPYV